MRLTMQDVENVRADEAARPLLSICVPTYNRSTVLEHCLRSLVDQVSAMDGERVEIIVFDNQSRDDTQPMSECLAEKHPFVRYVKLDARMEPGRCIVESAGPAEGRFVWIFGDDDVLDEGGLSRVVSELSGNKYDFLFLNCAVKDIEMKKTALPRLNSTSGDIVFSGYMEACRMFGFFSQPGVLASTVFRRELYMAAGQRAYIEAGDWYAHCGLLAASLYNRPGKYLSDPLVVRRLMQRETADSREKPHILIGPVVRMFHLLKEKGILDFPVMEQLIESDIMHPPAALSERVAAAFAPAVQSGLRIGPREWEEALQAAHSWRYARNVQAVIRAALVYIDRLRAKGSHDEAEQLVDMLSGGIFHSAEGHFFKGRILLKRDELEASTKAFQKTVEINPNHVEAYYLAARALWRLDRKDDARGALEKGLNLAPNHAEMGLFYADVLASTEQVDKAIIEYKRLLTAEPNDPRIHGKLGSALTLADRLDEAEKHLRRSLEIDPNTPGVHRALGVLLWNRGDKEEAMGHMESELDITPGDESLAVNLASMYKAEGRSAEALALETKPAP